MNQTDALGSLTQQDSIPGAVLSTSQATLLKSHILLSLCAMGLQYKKPGPQAASLHTFTGFTQSCPIWSVTKRAGEPPQAMFQIHFSQQQPFDTPQSACNKFQDIRIKWFLVLVFLSHGTVKFNIHFKNPELLPHSHQNYYHGVQKMKHYKNHPTWSMRCICKSWQ